MRPYRLSVLGRQEDMSSVPGNYTDLHQSLGSEDHHMPYTSWGSQAVWKQSTDQYHYRSYVGYKA